ncbi:type II toxin-antitoxin system VapC family toxin [Rhizobium rosettiformans]|uniref:type II toxin-antitoxin system VapC family toxin n=1 Tax=Rhizobium rosettiformans TaxID=1368430 RepID=UPI00285EF30E|nr:type II toxin-antitoxin system VapC family toxin [Rhizobium rosettiformans]MDR7029794.1 putative nucleic-acid-binding protein [Rhizobium rosettiformans]MDR7063508.1 putative nucleic-acid-binding protein [Rhizobium rosettiformans]
MMNIIADTNVLLRALVGDHKEQSKLAVDTLTEATLVTVSPQALCELVWVLDRSYGVEKADIVEVVRNLLETGNVVVDRGLVLHGLAFLEQGGDFADGVIDFSGRMMGGDAFVSFDRKAVRIVAEAGRAARLLS